MLTVSYVTLAYLNPVCSVHFQSVIILAMLYQALLTHLAIYIRTTLTAKSFGSCAKKEDLIVTAVIYCPRSNYLLWSFVQYSTLTDS